MRTCCGARGHRGRLHDRHWHDAAAVAGRRTAAVPRPGGAAASLFGLCTQTSSAAVGALLGYVLGDTAWPLAIAMALAGCSGLVLWVTTRGIRARTT